MLDFDSVRIPMPAIVIILIVLLLYFFVPGLNERPWTTLRIVGGFLAVIGYAGAFTARMQLGRSFSVRAQATELVTHGLYSRIRNPMYSFVDLMVIGLILVLHWYWLLLIFAVFVAFQVRQARREAKVLQAQFGDGYSNYCKQTWF